MFQAAIELVGGAEKQAALQFDDGGTAAVGGEDFHFLVGADALGEGLVAEQFAADDRATDLFADEQHHGEHDADARGCDQADRQGGDHHRRDHAEIEHGRALLEEGKTVTVDHARTDHDQDPRQRRHRHPGDQCAEQQKGHQRQHALDEARIAGQGAARHIHQRRAHGAGAGHAADHRRGDVAQALADQFAVRVVARTGQRIEHDTGLQRVDRQQHRESQRRHEQHREVGHAELAHAGPAPGHGVDKAAARATRSTRSTKWPDHQRVARIEQRRVEQGQAEVAQHAGQQRQDRRRHALGDARREQHGEYCRRADHHALPDPKRRVRQGMPQVGACGCAEKFRYLTGDDVEPDPGKVSADHRIRHVLDQPAEADAAEYHLQHARRQPECCQQHGDRSSIHAVLDSLYRKRRQHRRRRRAGGRDEPVGAAHRRGHQPHRRCAKNARQRPVRSIGAAEGRIDGDAEGNGGRQRHQHRSESAPKIAGQVFQSGEFHVLTCINFSGVDSVTKHRRLSELVH